MDGRYNGTVCRSLGMFSSDDLSNGNIGWPYVGKGRGAKSAQIGYQRGFGVVASVNRHRKATALYLSGIFLLMAAIGSLEAEVGCMARSRHAYWCDEGPDICCRPDYKVLYYVTCACPCSQYPQLAQYGRCSRCDHFRRPVEFY